MNCPVCSIVLTSTTYEGEPAGECRLCTGRFVQFSSLKTILEADSAPRSDATLAAALDAAGSSANCSPDAAPVRLCCECGTEMQRRIHAYDTGVWIDACADHGIWLDSGDLERLQAMAEATRRGGTIDPTPLGKTPYVWKTGRADDDPYGLTNTSSLSLHRDSWSSTPGLSGLFDGLF